MTTNPFTSAYFDFFNDLTVNNNREWFTENKARYEQDVREPLLQFISTMGPLLEEISPQIVADPRKSGGSMFRIYRDTRFSKDKTPYKTHGAVQFRHKMGKDVHAPGYYMHAGLREVVVGVGIWRPESSALAKIRKAVDENPEDWLAAKNHGPFTETMTWGGESLKRPPKGFAKDHALIEDLKRKDFVGFCSFPPPDLLTDNLVPRVTDAYRAGAPLMRFLCKALELPF